MSASSGHELAAHHVAELREPVEARRVVLGEDPDRVLVGVDHDDGTVGALVHQAERIADRVARGQRDRRLEHRMAGLDEPDDGLDHVDRDVLGEHGDAAAASDHLGHPATGDGGHVRHDERDRGADAIGCGEVDPEPRSDSRQARHHEHVVVREIVGWARMQHPHGRDQINWHRRRRPTLRTVTVPVVLVHGWGGSFASTWERSGFTALLADAGRDVIGVDLLGHGTAPKPHEPAAYADLTARIVDALAGRPGRRGRVLARRADAATDRDRRPGSVPTPRARRDRPQRVRARRRGDGSDPRRCRRHRRPLMTTTSAGCSASTRASQGNDAAGARRRPAAAGLRPDHAGGRRECQRARCSWHSATTTSPSPPTRSSTRSPTPRYVTLRNTDHFATPESFAFIDAALEFLDAVPALMPDRDRDRGRDSHARCRRSRRAAHAGRRRRGAHRDRLRPRRRRREPGGRRPHLRDQGPAAPATR